MSGKLNFSLVSPERELFSGAVDQVVVPGDEGDFGVLPGHAPFMSTVRAAALVVHDGDSRRRVFVRGGFAEVGPDGLTVLAEEAIDVTDLDAATLEQALRDAQEDLRDAEDDDHRRRAEIAVARAEAMLAALSATGY
ncbi:MAG: F0F1 ATP synthase subunit epsilon [Maricaulaceae bacterium]